MYFPKVLRPRPILFDLGDTLLNFTATNPLPYFKEGVRLAYDFIAQQSDALPPYKKFHAAVRRSYAWAFVTATVRRREVDLHTSLIRLFERLALPSDHDFVMAVGERLYRPMKQLGAVEEGVHAVLDRLVAQGHPLGIVSNTMVPAPMLDQHLQEVDLLKYFQVRLYSCDVGVRKPRAAMFLPALRALNCKPQHTLFVGDKLKLDIRGARRLGMITVLKVRVGKPPKSRYQPDHVIKHLTELPGLLDRISWHCPETPPLLPQSEFPARRFLPRPHETKTNSTPRYLAPGMPGVPRTTED
ncbi:MAG: HAD family hydrolase [Planctomycetes bacterium]|nr:HAD family hydrolase [Planctomycetota bacterium]